MEATNVVRFPKLGQDRVIVARVDVILSFAECSVVEYVLGSKARDARGTTKDKQRIRTMTAMNATTPSAAKETKSVS